MRVRRVVALGAAPEESLAGAREQRVPMQFESLLSSKIPILRTSGPLDPDACMT
jgi:hypothetical protein